MAQRRKRQSRKQVRAPNPYGTMDYAMRGMVDMSRMAVFGTVTAGTLGIVGSLIKK